MEDLLENFSKHINKVISSKLGSKIRNLARATTNYRTDEDYSRMESNIQMLIESYLSNLKDNEYKEIANNIFNSFVEEDDKNLIKAINFFKRTYEYYQELNLRKKFFKWRKTSLKLKMINNLVSKEMKSKKENNNNIINKNKIQLNEVRYKDNDINDDKEENNNYNINMDEEFGKNSNIIKGNNFENVEEFINNGNNNQSYKFNYGEYMDNNEDFKEEFREELDVNKLYSKKKYNN
jgi:hypothetical protein